jgi:hypothetical protein
VIPELQIQCHQEMALLQPDLEINTKQMAFLMKFVLGSHRGTQLLPMGEGTTKAQDMVMEESNRAGMVYSTTTFCVNVQICAYLSAHLV